jgi:hypothetical protein
MNRLLVSVLTGIVLLTSCSTANEIRNRDKFSYVEDNNVSAKDSSHIVNGRIYRGMPVEHAIASLGRPLNRDTSHWNGQTQVKLTYRARPKRTRGYMNRAYVYAVNDSVTNWKDLNTIPRFDAYYEIGN